MKEAATRMRVRSCTACGGSIRCRGSFGIHPGTCWNESIATPDKAPQCWKAAAGTAAPVARKLLESLSAKRSKGARHTQTIRQRARFSAALIDAVQAGPVTTEWMNRWVEDVGPHMVAHIFAELKGLLPESAKPQSDITGLLAINRIRARLQKADCGDLAKLFEDYLDARFAFRQRGLDHEWTGSHELLKITSIRREAGPIAAFIEYLAQKGSLNISDVTQRDVDDFIDQSGSSVSQTRYIADFMKWVSKRRPFVLRPRFKRRNMLHSPYRALSIEESQAAYERLMAAENLRARFAGLLCLLYGQSCSHLAQLRLEALQLDGETAKLLVTDVPLVLDQDTGTAAQAWLEERKVRLEDQRATEGSPHLFPSRVPMASISNKELARQVKTAAGVDVGTLRRTGILNIYRAGGRTLATPTKILGASQALARKAAKLYWSVSEAATAEGAASLRERLLSFRNTG